MSRWTFPVTLIAMLACGSLAWAQSFTLDNNPSAPLAPDSIGPIPGFGAEDPFGLLTTPGLAPSPTLGILATRDGSILSPGPVLQHSGPNGSYVDSLSANHRQGEVSLMFSVDRLAVGMPGTDVALEAAAFEQPADIFASIHTADPSLLAGTLTPGFNGPLVTVGAGGPFNSQLIDQAALGLVAPASPINHGTHDNIDGLERRSFDGDRDGVFNIDGYFTIYPDESVSVGTSAADIYSVGAGAPGAIPTAYAPAVTLGLDTLGTNTDSVDALIMFDFGSGPIPIGETGAPGAVDPGVDYALFSLAPGSASLLAFGVSPGDILFSDFTGGFGIYATTMDLGLAPLDNVDALGIVPEPASMGLFGLGLVMLIGVRRRSR